MAPKFKVGERAKYTGEVVGPASAGRECIIEAVDAMIWPGDGSGLERSRRRYPGQIIYQVTWCKIPTSCGLIPESELEKLIPKHQPDDLKVAEPQFINHQLPRWLGLPEKEKTLETE